MNERIELVMGEKFFLPHVVFGVIKNSIKQFGVNNHLDISAKVGNTRLKVELYGRRRRILLSKSTDDYDEWIKLTPKGIVDFGRDGKEKDPRLGLLMKTSREADKDYLRQLSQEARGQAATQILIEYLTFLELQGNNLWDGLLFDKLQEKPKT